MNRRDKQLLLTSKKLRALVPPFYSFRKEKKIRGNSQSPLLGPALNYVLMSRFAQPFYSEPGPSIMGSAFKEDRTSFSFIYKALKDFWTE